MQTGTDIFEISDPSRGLSDPRNRPVRMADPAEEDERLRKVTSPDQMMALFREAVEEEMPKASEIARYEAEGYRFRIEEGEFIITGIVGHVSPAMFKWMVKQRLRKDNQGTYLYTIHQTQSNGTWVPTALGIRPGVRPMNDHVRSAKHRLPSGTLPLQIGKDEASFDEVLPVRTDVLEYRIVWTDAAGLDDLKYDPKGQLVTGMDLHVQTGTDPAVAQAMAASAAATQKLAEAVETIATTPRAPSGEPRRRHRKKSEPSVTQE